MDIFMIVLVVLFFALLLQLHTYTADCTECTFIVDTQRFRVDCKFPLSGALEI